MGWREAREMEREGGMAVAAFWKKTNKPQWRLPLFGGKKKHKKKLKPETEKKWKLNRRLTFSAIDGLFLLFFPRLRYFPLSIIFEWKASR